MRWMLAAVPLLLAPAAFAAALPVAPSPYDNVSLSTEATVEAANDLMQVDLYLEERGTDAAALADRANRIMAQALQTARRYPTVQVRSGNYQTTPEYRYDEALKKSVMTGWLIRQDLHLRSRDGAALKRLAGDLQQTLKVGNMQFSVSPAARQAAENTAIQQALAAFRQRARLIEQQLGASSYRIRNLNISTEEPHRVYPMTAGAMRMEAAPAAPPAATPGASDITVRVSGTIHLGH